MTKQLTLTPNDLPADTQLAGFSITALGIAQICSWGTLYYSFPQLAEAMILEFSWSKSETYGALTLGLLLSAFAGLPIGSAIDKGHGRLVMTIGSVVAGILFIIGSQLSSLTFFYILFASIGFLHSATLYEAAFAVIANRFNTEDSKKHITSLTLWGGFASTVFIPLNEWVLQTLDWRSLMLMMGFINIFVCAVIYYRLPRPATNLIALHCFEKEKNLKEEQVKPKRNLTWALTQPIFWALLICFAFFAAATTAFKFHLYPMLLEKGLSASEVVAVLAILGPAQVVGRLLLRLYAEKISIMYLGIITASVLPIVFAAVAFLPTEFWILVPFAILFGAATGVMTIVKGIAIPELLTRDAYGAINGAMNLPIKTIKALSPSIAVFIWLLAGGYQGLLEVLIVCGIFSVLCFVIAVFVIRKAKQAEK